MLIRREKITQREIKEKYERYIINKIKNNLILFLSACHIF